MNKLKQKAKMKNIVSIWRLPTETKFNEIIKPEKPDESSNVKNESAAEHKTKEDLI